MIFSMKKIFNLQLEFFKKCHQSYLYFRFLVWYIFLNEFIFDFFLLEGESMLPTFDAYGNIVIIDKLSYKFDAFKFKRNDIVCLVNPVNPKMLMCKRIWKMENDVIFDDGFQLERVNKNYIWVEGDNKENSLDSRKFGPVHKELIKGRVLMKVWPKLEFYGI